LTVALLASASLFAKDFTLTAGITAWAVDANAANEPTYPALVPAFDLSYKMKMDGYALNFGLAGEDALINYSGLTWLEPPQQKALPAEFINVGRGEPYVEFLKGGLRIHAGLALYSFSPNSPSTDFNGFKNGLKWMYKGVGLQYWTYKNNSTDFSTANNVVFSNYDEVSYKIVFSDKFSITPDVQYEVMFIPAFATAEIDPAIAFTYGPVTLNALAMYIPIAEGPGLPQMNSAGNVVSYNTYYLTLNPKLIVNFNTLGVKGLTASLGSSIPIKTEKYEDKGLAFIPAAGYKIGPYSFAAGVSMEYLDYASSDSRLYKQAEYDPFVKAFYTVKF
jgi:hypothetical protein